MSKREAHMGSRPQRVMVPLDPPEEMAPTQELQRLDVRVARRPPSRDVVGQQARRFSTSGSAIGLQRGDVSVETAWRGVRQFMRARFGLALAPAQSYLLDGRLAGVPAALGFRSLSAYLVTAASAGASPALVEPLIDALTVSESSFFRDEPTWDALDCSILPGLLARAHGGPLRVWCAGCGGGQEAYSLAMRVHEFDARAAANLHIVATDIAPQALDRARAGLYGASELARTVSAERLQRHFIRRGAAFEVAPHLRERVRVMRHNLLDAPPMLRCDLVLCRNTLFFLDAGERDGVLARLWSAVGAGGALGVESTELLPDRALGDGWYARD
jgi:chemotaxis protein methyltransferase CheR